MKQIKRHLDPNMYQNILSNSEDYVWLNMKEETIVSVEGFPWLKEDHMFRRLPLNVKEDIQKLHSSLNPISEYTSGGILRFRTNAEKIGLIVKSHNPDHMIHMTELNQQGFDLYIGYNDQPYRFYNITRFFAGNADYDTELKLENPGEWKDIILNFPNYGTIQELYLGYSKDGNIEAPKPHKNDGKIIFYGTSITQGGCASRPGVSVVNMLGRKLDVETVNMSFTGNAFGEKEIAQIISTIDHPRGYVLDYEANSRGGNMEKSLETFIRILRDAHPECKVLVLSRLPYVMEEILPWRKEQASFYQQFEKEIVDKFDSKMVKFVNCHDIFGDDYDEFYIDTIHPTDTGFYFFYQYLNPIMKEFFELK